MNHSQDKFYDSLHRIEHYYQILPQLKLLYGVDNLSRVDFLPVHNKEQILPVVYLQ